MTSESGHVVSVVGATAAGAYADGVLAVWERAFGPVEDRDGWSATVWDRHRSRAGYRLALAVADERVVGFGWGYTGDRGQYWPDLVASRLGAPAEQWLGGHFELAELAVDPDTRRLGLGLRLHDALLAGVPHERALLGTSSDEADPAVRLYRRRGWERLGFLDDGTQVMGLRRPGTTVAAAAGWPASSSVTETFAYDGGRRVTVWVPRSRPELVVIAGDGQLVAGWGADLEASGVPPTMVVGVHRTDDEDELARLREYSPSFDAETFAAHEAFVVDDVRRWVQDRFAITLEAGRTAVLGVSAGAELALALGLRHPDLFGVVLAASPGGGFVPPARLPEPVPRVYLTAGTSEPWFLANAARWADALDRAGADVVLTRRPGEHGGPFWQAELPLMVAWALADASAGR